MTIYQDTKRQIQTLSTMLTQMDLSSARMDDYTEDFEVLEQSLKIFHDNLMPLYKKMTEPMVVKSFYEDCQDITDLCKLYGLSPAEVSMVLRNGSRDFFKQK